MEPQVWSGDVRPTKDSFKNVKPSKHHFGKPGGGFWTSPYKNGSSPWIKYAKSVGLTGINDEKQWVLIPNSSARVLEIHDKKDLMMVETTSIDGHPTINYENIFEKYDAIHVSEDMIGYRQFQEWGCESVLWSNWKFDQVIPMDQYE